MAEDKILLWLLPKSLLVQFLTEWLDIREVGVLDSAMTNKEHRPEFLQCLQEMRNRSVPVSFNGFCGDDGTMPRWISVRQIHVKTFSLFGFDKEFIEDLHLPSLQKLEVLSPPWLRHVPQLSPLLEELSIGQFSTRAIMEDLVFVLKKILLKML